MKRLTATSLLLFLATLIPGFAPGPQDPAPPLRVGVFDTRGVALAYGRSQVPEGMLTEVNRLRAEHDKATEKRDTARAKQLEDRAVALQDRIHDQVFDGGAIDEILAKIGPKARARAAEAAGVQLIAAEGDLLFVHPDVERVDVTLELSAMFEPDGETRKLIGDLLAR